MYKQKTDDFCQNTCVNGLKFFAIAYTRALESSFLQCMKQCWTKFCCYELSQKQMGPEEGADTHPLNIINYVVLLKV